MLTQQSNTTQETESMISASLQAKTWLFAMASSGWGSPWVAESGYLDAHDQRLPKD